MRYTSQETLQNPQIHRVGNPVFPRHRQGYPRNRQRCLRNRQRVSAKLSKGVRGFVEGHQHSQNRQRLPRNCTVFLE